MEDTYSMSIYWSNEDDAFIALSPEFPGLSAFGPSREEAVREAGEALAAMSESLLEDGETLPEPRLLPQHSGQLRIRIPKSLHTRLSLEAERQGISLNMLMAGFLEQGHARNDALQAMRGEMEAMKRLLHSIRSDLAALKDNRQETEHAFSAGAAMGANLVFTSLEVQASYKPITQPIPHVYLRR